MDLSVEKQIFTSSPQAHGEERGPLRKYPIFILISSPFFLQLNDSG